MIPFSSYQLYQAERSVSEAERRQADVRAGQLAAIVGSLRSWFRGRAKALFVGILGGVPRRAGTAPAES